jgi:hypothetical protein
MEMEELLVNGAYYLDILLTDKYLSFKSHH